jgi:protocatechuate 3,4-dioxygenase alpha subunit
MTNITTSQTIGPFSHEAWQVGRRRLSRATAGAVPTILVSGIIYDGAGVPINDAQIEAWSPPRGAEAAGFPASAAFPAANGEFSLRLSALRRKPASRWPTSPCSRAAWSSTSSPPCSSKTTRSLAQSAILEQVPAARRATLIARKTADGQYSWDIWMQGEQETAFFDYV